MSKINTTTEFRAILKNETVFREVHGIDLINRKALVYISGSLEWIIYKKGTLCQFTGLEDKEGNKIFEGDIVSVEDFPNAAIQWSEVNSGFWLGTSAPLTNGQAKHCEVIGNIFTTPELLKA